MTAPTAVVRRGDLDRRWRQVAPIALDDDLLRPAGSVADAEGLRAIDAIHLATALRVGAGRTLFVTWERRLAAAAAVAARLGLATAPAHAGA